MTGSSERPLLVLPSRSASRLLQAMAKSKKVWAALGGILVVAILLPAAAKAPVALVLAGVLLVPIVRGLKDPATTEAVGSQRWRDPAQAVRFDGSLRRSGSRSRWRQVRCLISGAELLVSSYWRRNQPPQVISLNSSEITSVATSTVRDGLKPGLMRIIRLQLADGSTLQLAVDLAVAEAVQGALAAHI